MKMKIMIIIHGNILNYFMRIYMRLKEKEFKFTRFIPTYLQKTLLHYVVCRILKIPMNS